jgi:hypothetical protein
VGTRSPERNKPPPLELVPQSTFGAGMTARTKGVVAGPT